MMADESLSFVDLIEREPFDDLIVDSLWEEDFFPVDDFKLFVEGFEGFFDGFCVCFVECCL